MELHISGFFANQSCFNLKSWSVWGISTGLGPRKQQNGNKDNENNVLECDAEN